MNTTDAFRSGCVALAASFVLSSCSSLAARRAHYIQLNPALSVDIKNAIVHGDIVKGMRLEDVRASWGKPDTEVREMNAGGQEVIRWSYLVRTGPYINVHEVRFVGGVVSERESFDRKWIYRPSPEEGFEPAILK